MKAFLLVERDPQNPLGGIPDKEIYKHDILGIVVGPISEAATRFGARVYKIPEDGGLVTLVHFPRELFGNVPEQDDYFHYRKGELDLKIKGHQQDGLYFYAFEEKVL